MTFASESPLTISCHREGGYANGHLTCICYKEYWCFRKVILNFFKDDKQSLTEHATLSSFHAFIEDVLLN